MTCTFSLSCTCCRERREKKNSLPDRSTLGPYVYEHRTGQFHRMFSGDSFLFTTSSIDVQPEKSTKSQVNYSDLTSHGLVCDMNTRYTDGRVSAEHVDDVNRRLV